MARRGDYLYLAVANIASGETAVEDELFGTLHLPTSNRDRKVKVFPRRGHVVVESVDSRARQAKVPPVNVTTAESF